MTGKTRGGSASLVHIDTLAVNAMVGFALIGTLGMVLAGKTKSLFGNCITAFDVGM